MTEVSELGVRATALQVAAETMERSRFGSHANGSYAALILALDYLGFCLVMIPGRPGFDMLSSATTEPCVALFREDAEKTSEEIMERGHSVPEWKEALLEALRLTTGGKQLIFSTILTPALGLIDASPISDGQALIGVAISPPTISLVASYGHSSVLLHPAAPEISFKAIHFLAEEGYRLSCNDAPQRNSNLCISFMPNCREDFRLLAEKVEKYL